MNHFNLITRLAHWAATIAAGVVAIGAAIGFYEMTGNIWIAILAGAGIASILAIGWWVLISMGAQSRKTSSKVMVIALGVFLVAAAIGTSGWALATAIGGNSAITVHNQEQINEHEAALNAAYARVTSQADLKDAVSTAEAAYRGAASAEAAGDLSGRAGCGPNCRTYQRQATALSGVLDQLNGQLDEAGQKHEQGMILLGEARKAEDPSVALFEVADIVAALSAIELKAEGGIVNYTAGADGVTFNGTDQLTGMIDAAHGTDMEPVETPTYSEITEAEAVLLYADRVIGAWIAAFAIDTAPLLMLLMVMVSVSEPLLREQMKPKTKVTNQEIVAAEKVMSGTLVPMKPREVAGFKASREVSSDARTKEET